MTDALFDAVPAAGTVGLDGFSKASAGFARLLTACPGSGPLAYVEAEYFGGAGTQTAQVWGGGKTLLGPLSLAEGEPSPTTGTPISQALRRLGAAKGSCVDEFEAVGLGRHRDTDDWLSPANGAQA
ncbi:hypothetical protein [Streptomyces sp. NBC_00347]|uniref:hypothetical protein n=1 Tax=Streptomyces sp. NBC_00347 TaxID=2975721 RepID=UPI00225101D2|nr:hypothetical protein [Streptomyces sp. NBC_00347]MCX5128417.1 hypothetical protein [Streptomyces sp. NBC_00347]